MSLVLYPQLGDFYQAQEVCQNIGMVAAKISSPKEYQEVVDFINNPDILIETPTIWVDFPHIDTNRKEFNFKESGKSFNCFQFSNKELTDVSCNKQNSILCRLPEETQEEFTTPSGRTFSLIHDDQVNTFDEAVDHCVDKGLVLAKIVSEADYLNISGQVLNLDSVTEPIKVWIGLKRVVNNASPLNYKFVDNLANPEEARFVLDKGRRDFPWEPNQENPDASESNPICVVLETSAFGMFLRDEPCSTNIDFHLCSSPTPFEEYPIGNFRLFPGPSNFEQAKQGCLDNNLVLAQIISEEQLDEVSFGLAVLQETFQNAWLGIRQVDATEGSISDTPRSYRFVDLTAEDSDEELIFNKRFGTRPWQGGQPQSFNKECVRSTISFDHRALLRTESCGNSSFAFLCSPPVRKRVVQGFSNSEFVLFREVETFTAAQTICQDNGLSVAIIGNRRDYNKIQALFRRQLSVTEAWVGLQRGLELGVDLDRSSPQSYEIVSINASKNEESFMLKKRTGTRPWGEGQPRNQSTDCAVMARDLEYFLKDKECNAASQVFCFRRVFDSSGDSSAEAVASIALISSAVCIVVVVGLYMQLKRLKSIYRMLEIEHFEAGNRVRTMFEE